MDVIGAPVSYWLGMPRRRQWSSGSLSTAVGAGARCAWGITTMTDSGGIIVMAMGVECT